MVPPKLAPHHTHLICVNYCSDYHTSETAMDLDELAGLVNYYLDYGTSETRARCVVSVFFSELLLGLRYFRNRYTQQRCLPKVNYCLIYGTSETNQVRLAAGEVNYYLDYGASETPILRTLKA